MKVAEKFYLVPRQEKLDVLEDLAKKISIVGSTLVYPNQDKATYLSISVKGNTNNVKAILKKYFDIKFERVVCYEKMGEVMYADRKDIEELCRMYLELNVGHLLEYYSKYDPLRTKPTVDKVIYQYGKVIYDLL